MELERLESELAEARRRVELAMRKPPGRGADADAAFSAALDKELAAERALAAARGEEYAVPFELGVRWSGGAPLPHLLSSGLRSFVAFYLEERDPNWDGTYVRIVDPTDGTVESLALAEFEGSVAVKLGPPNDEVLHGHPLEGRGLAGYGAYVVENSRWLEALIEINCVHERFDPQSWQDKRHFLLVFHDETVEAIARGIDARPVRTSMRALLAETVEKLWPE
ncbi:MAG TPA: hypothetical protein VF101_18865 [Gaiellaceae bacterium]